MARKGKYFEKSVKQAIKDKMRVLDDFGICKIDDANMIIKLQDEIAKYPDKDPRIVLDSYCRPMINEMINSWV